MLHAQTNPCMCVDLSLDGELWGVRTGPWAVGPLGSRRLQALGCWGAFSKTPVNQLYNQDQLAVFVGRLLLVLLELRL